MDRNQFLTIWNTCANNPHDGHSDKHYGWWAQQNQDEFWWLMEKVSSIGAKKILEIGSAHGGTLYFWTQQAGPDGQVVSVDLWDSHGITLNFNNVPSDTTLLKADSHLQATVDTVTDVFGGPIDFLFIDGDHSYEGAKQDYEMFSPLVRPGGIVAFHDVIYDTDIQVRRFFKEITKPKETIELYHGIGVVYE